MLTMTNQDNKIVRPVCRSGFGEEANIYCCVLFTI